MIDQHELVEFAQHIAELHRLAADGLIIVKRGERDGFQFPQPDHPRVVAWRSHRKPDAEMRDRAWLLYEAGQMVAEARATHRAPGIIEAAYRFARSIPDMPLSDVRRHLAHFLSADAASAGVRKPV